MIIKHFYLDKIAHSSYMLIGNKNSAVIDPQRDVNIYIEEAKRRGATISHIIHTHLHADFVSGHMDLAELTGAPVYVPKAAGCTFEHEAVIENDIIEIEDMQLKVLETPGHTPEHVSYVVTDISRGSEPVAVLVGDAIFVGDVGRPDIFPDAANKLAGELYHSLHDKLLKLPDHCEIYPAHGSGSLCGRTIGAKYTSTIGYEKLYNQALGITDKKEFINSLTSDMPAAPDHFLRCSDINRIGPKILSEFPGLEELEIEQFIEATRKDESVVVDTRHYAAFSAFHIPGSYNIGLGGNFPIYLGWVIPPDKEIYLVTEDTDDARTAELWARRVGMDCIAGYLSGGITELAMTGKDFNTAPLISARDIKNIKNGYDHVCLVDIRTPQEYEQAIFQALLMFRYRNYVPATWN